MNKMSRAADAVLCVQAPKCVWMTVFLSPAQARLIEATWGVKETGS